VTQSVDDGAGTIFTGIGRLCRRKAMHARVRPAHDDVARPMWT
jgi:hypothetical protein